MQTVMRNVAQKNRSNQRSFFNQYTIKNLVFLFIYAFFCLNPKYERIQSTALNEAQGKKAQLCIKKAPVIKQGLFNLEIRT